MKINKTINSEVDLIYYFGKNLLVRKNDHFFILNSVEKIIFECIMNGYSFVQIIKELSKYLNTSSNKDIISKTLQNYFNTPIGIELYEESESLKNAELKTIGLSGKFYPKYLQIELTKKCNLKCPHCYKEANDFSNFNNILPTEMLYELSNFLDSNLLTIGLTGGEPLLHPDFEIIAETFSKKYRLELNSNGVLINNLDITTIKRFSAMSISLYGTSENEYKKNTNSTDAFKNLLLSSEKLKRSHMKFNVSVIVTNDNKTRLEEYVLLAIELGASTLQFGTANPIGRGIYLSNTKPSWLLTVEEKRQVYRTIRYLENKYSSKIKIIGWLRDQYEKAKNFDLSKIYYNESLRCGAGTTDWAVNEKMMFRPCVICPEIDCMNISFEKWKKYVNGEFVINWKSVISDLKSYCDLKKLGLINYCNRFEDILKTAGEN